VIEPSGFLTEAGAEVVRAGKVTDPSEFVTEPSWFVTPACCGGLFLHPVMIKVIGAMGTHPVAVSPNQRTVRRLSPENLP
jgi:hypothetical protein